MASEEVTRICNRTVVSTKPVQPGKYYPFSVFDRIMEKNHIKMVYYFPSMGNGGEAAAGELTKKLRESLSEVLTCFPIVTGRLLLQKKNNDDEEQEGHYWMIKCNDAGVRMVEARAKGSVEEWLKNVDRDKELQLVAWEDMFHKPYFWATFYFQLTEFEKGGLAIGFSCSHLLADPTTATMFIKAWADTTLAGTMLSPPFFHPLPPRRLGNKNPNHEPYTNLLINHYESTIERSTALTHNNITTKHVIISTVTLAFSDHMVRACMLDASSPSPFLALAGLLWVCVSKVKGLNQAAGLIDMSICLDMRKQLGLDKGFFGNCMACNKVNAGLIKISAKNKLSEAARVIRESVTKMDNEGIMDLIEWLEHIGSQKSITLMNGYDLVCANLEDLDPYAAVFEEGFVPSKVSYYVEPAFGIGQVLILQSPPGDEGPLSRTVMVTLLEDELVRLCEDDLILKYNPTIVMGVNERN